MDMKFPPGFLTTSTYDTLTKEYGWLLSILAGIVMCKMVYVITGAISHSIFMGYRKLNKAQKLEWNNRGISTFHAFFVAVASVYILLVSDVFKEGPGTGFIIFRTSTFSSAALGISLGYFISDLAMILWNFPALGGMEYVLHHGLSMFSIIQALVSGEAHFYILMVLFTETTTPSVNMRWYLDVAGQKNSILYTCNGIALFLGWLLRWPCYLSAYLESYSQELLDILLNPFKVVRILWFIYFFYHMFNHFDQVEQMYPVGFYSMITIPPVLTMMNVFWFWKITKGMIKTLTKARHSA